MPACGPTRWPAWRWRTGARDPGSLAGGSSADDLLLRPSGADLQRRDLQPCRAAGPVVRCRPNVSRTLGQRGSGRGVRRMGGRGDLASSSACSRSRSGTAQTRTLTLARDRIGLKPLFWGHFGHLFLFGPSSRPCAPIRAGHPEIDRKSLGPSCAGDTCRPSIDRPRISQTVARPFPGPASAERSPVRAYWDPAQVPPARKPIGCNSAKPRLSSARGAARRRRWPAHDRRRAAGRVSFGRDRFLADRALMQARSQPSGAHLRHRLPGEALRRDRTPAGGGEAPGHRPLGAGGVVRRRAWPSSRSFPTGSTNPSPSARQIPAMMVSRLARRDVTVALSGDGGDELFGGYPGYTIVQRGARGHAGLPPPLRRRVAAPGRRLDRADHRPSTAIIPQAHRPGLLANQCPADHRRPARRRRHQRVLRRALQCRRRASATQGRVSGRSTRCAGRRPEHRDVVTDPIDRMGYFALLGTLVDGSLAKGDRASMACSLEVRVPFLDHRVVEFAWRLPPALKYRSAAGSKRLLRQLLYRYVPGELVDRPKKGFSSPLARLAAWPAARVGRGPARRAAAGPGRPLRSRCVRACWSQHLRPPQDHRQLLWSVLMFRQWRGRWV